MKPRRIQRKRTRGWRMPPNTVYVGRPTKWGNPYRPGEGLSAAEAMQGYRDLLYINDANPDRVGLTDAQRELRGKNLACWCPIGQPCHADVLLEIANA
jgi:hypothetical protein